MDNYMMLTGLTNRDFSALGSILATAATGAAIHGLMYPLTEVAYGLSDNFIKNVTPESWRKPLPQGYKPQVVKMDKPNFQDKGKEWDDHKIIMDQLDGDQLKGYTRTLDPKYSNDIYRYLMSRGINPSGKDDNDYYISSLKGTKLDLSEKDDLPKDNITNDQTAKDARRGLIGAGAYLLLHKNKPGDRPLKNILKAGLVGVGTAAVLNALDKKGSESGDTVPMAASCKDMSSGTLYIESTRSPGLRYPIEYDKKLFGKVNATYRADKPTLRYGTEDIEINDDFRKFINDASSAIKVVDSTNSDGISFKDSELATSKLLQRYPLSNKNRVNLNVKYPAIIKDNRDMSMLKGLFN